MMPFQISNLLNGENNALSDMLKAIPILETRSRYYQNLSYAPVEYVDTVSHKMALCILSERNRNLRAAHA